VLNAINNSLNKYKSKWMAGSKEEKTGDGGSFVLKGWLRKMYQLKAPFKSQWLRK